MKRRHNVKKRINNYVELQGVHFMRRMDLKSWDGSLNGRFHIQNPDIPNEGLCCSSTTDYFSRCAVVKPRLELVPEDECPKSDQICLNCYIAHNKRRKEMSRLVFSATDIMNLNGVNFIRESSVTATVNELVGKTREIALEEGAKVSYTQNGVIVNGAKYFDRNAMPVIETISDHCIIVNGVPYKKIVVPEISAVQKKGEVRTIQATARKVNFVPGKFDKKIHTTELTIKTTPIEYRVGQKIRITIED